MGSFSLKSLPSNYMQFIMGVPALYGAQVLLLGNKIQLEMSTGLSVHRPKITGYEVLSFKNQKHMEVYSLIYIIFGFWATYGANAMLNGMQIKKLKKD